jgi:hypothetical protein
MTQATDQALVAAAPPVRAIPGNEAAKGPQPVVALTDPVRWRGRCSVQG